jgi:molecular chaperone HtpG
MKEKGSISIHTENIFPIIKKFLYSDHEIFLRELVSNAVDATQKLKKLASIGEFSGELGDTKIEVSFDKKKNHHCKRQRHWHDGRRNEKVHQSDRFFWCG